MKRYTTYKGSNSRSLDVRVIKGQYVANLVTLGVPPPRVCSTKFIRVNVIRGLSTVSRGSSLTGPRSHCGVRDVPPHLRLLRNTLIVYPTSYADDTRLSSKVSHMVWTTCNILEFKKSTASIVGSVDHKPRSCCRRTAQRRLSPHTNTQSPKGRALPFSTPHPTSHDGKAQ